MRRPRRAAGTGSRHLSLSATDAEWDVVRRNAQARGLSIARYLMGLVERGGTEQGATVSLTRDEQRELLRSVREVRALMLGQEVPEEAESGEAEPAHPPPLEAAPERTGPEGSGGDGEAERLRREIRDWPGRAEALIADTPAPVAPLADLTERRQRMEALLAEAEAMRAAGSPHTPHLEAMPEESAALAKAETLLADMRTAVELSEMALLTRKALQLADEAGGIEYDTPAYSDLMERIRSLEVSRGLPEEAREPIRALIARDARWRRDRKRVADFLGRARGAARARGDLEEEIRALHEPAGAASPERGPGQAPERGPGQAPDWRAAAEGVLRDSTALVEAMPARELGAHLVAAGATLEELGELTARLRAMLGRG
ncbi:MAG: hypothetical protein OYL41_03290 [Acidobacteriota bacterium]|nr:hypothetical protein [Acidobacteriota bacterium]